MSKLWRITPLEKKSIEYFIDVYQQMADGSIRGFDVTFTYRWGQAFRDEDNPPSKWEANQNTIHADPQIGWGCEFDDLCGVHVNFSDGFSSSEKLDIEAFLRGEKTDDEDRWGEAWIFDGDHDWAIEEDVVYVYKPFKIDLVDENHYNKVIEENVTLED